MSQQYQLASGVGTEEIAKEQLELRLKRMCLLFSPMLG